jgi:hypothetical protein
MQTTKYKKKEGGLTSSQNTRLGKTPTLQINLSSKTPLEYSLPLNSNGIEETHSECFSNTMGSVNQFSYVPEQS